MRRITAVGGYFQMSLTAHQTSQKQPCRRRRIMCERDLDSRRLVGARRWWWWWWWWWMEEGGREGGWGDSFGAWNISCLKGGKRGGGIVNLPEWRYPELGCQPWHISQRNVTQTEWCLAVHLVHSQVSLPNKRSPLSQQSFCCFFGCFRLL